MTREVLDNQLVIAEAIIAKARVTDDFDKVVGYINRAMNCLYRAAQEADFQAEQADRLQATGQEVKP